MSIFQLHDIKIIWWFDGSMTSSGEASNNFMRCPSKSNQSHKKLLHLKSNLE